MKTRPLPLRRVFLLGAALLVPGATARAAEISFDGTTAYTQDFSSMTGSARVTTQSLNVNTMTEVSTLLTGGGVSGWYILPQAGTGSNAWTTSSSKWHGADDGSSTSGGFRQLYDTSGGRALGAQGSGSAFGFFGLVLRNTSSATIDALSLSYDAVMNRNPTTTVNPYPLSYLVSSTAVSASTTIGDAGTFSAAMTATTLGFSTPASGTGAPSATAAAISPMFKIGTMAGNLSGLGWAAGQYLYLAWRETDNSGGDSLAGVDNFSLQAVVVRNLVWSPVGGGTWDSASANWTNNSTPTTYAAGDGVSFTGAGGTITLSGALAPLSVNVSNASGVYVFTGATAADKVTGAAALTKSGAGSLQLTSDNDYSGGTTISGGAIVVDGAGRLGTGGIALAGGTLQFAAGAYTVANALSVGAAGGTIDAAADRTISGAVSLAGILTKSSAGTLTLGSAVSSSAGAAFTIAAGDLVLGQASGVVKVFANSTLTGNLVIGGPIRFDVNGSSTISGPGAIKVVSSGTLISSTSADVGGTVSSEIVLNSTAAAFTKGGWTGATYTPSSTFSFTVGGTTGGVLTVAKLSGDADVDFSNNSTTGGGAGTLVLTAVSTYTGNTTISANTPASPATDSIRLGVNNALPTTTGIIFGTKTGVGKPIINLNGYSQQVAYLADGANVSSAKFLTITNGGASPSTLTVGGDTTPGTGFSGLLSDGAGVLTLVKTGANTQVLTGSGTFTGGVTVNGGVLKVVAATVATNSSALGTGAVTVGGTGQLFVAAKISNDVTVNTGGRLAGKGTIGDINGGGVTLTSGGVLVAAADETSQLRIASLKVGTLVVLPGAIIEWKIKDATGPTGVGQDTFDFNNLGFDLSGLSAANRAVIRVISFTADGDTSFSALPSLLPGEKRGFVFATSPTVTLGANPSIASLFTYDLSQFRYADGSSSHAGLWSLDYDGSSAITLSAVPEPSTYGLGLGLVGLLAAAIRRRRPRGER